MSQSTFSTYILLIGIVLIFYNTSVMIFNLGFELVVLVTSLGWSILKIIFTAISHYPLTLILLLFYAYQNKNKTPTRGNRSLFNIMLMKAFAQNQQCSICLEPNVDKLLTQCGHFYHSRCVDPWIRKCQQCPFCRATVPYIEANLGSKISLRTLKCFVKANKQKILFVFLAALIIGFKHNEWWSQLSFISSENTKQTVMRSTQNYCPRQNISDYFKV